MEAPTAAIHDFLAARRIRWKARRPTQRYIRRCPQGQISPTSRHRGERSTGEMMEARCYGQIFAGTKYAERRPAELPAARPHRPTACSVERAAVRAPVAP